MTDSDTAWIDVLKDAGYPIDVVVLDWETYFSKDYSLKKMSTVEYIEDDRFEELGVAVLLRSGDRPGAEPEAVFWPDVFGEIAWLQSQYGKNLERCTVTWHNGRFDGTILCRKYGILPPYSIDTLDLASHINCRVKNSLAALCERYGLPAKGDTMQFEGLHWDRGRGSGPPAFGRKYMTTEQQAAMGAYARNDAEQQWSVFKLLLPQLSRPAFELAVMHQTHMLYWEPCLGIDFEAAEQLSEDMDAEIDKGADRVGHTRKDLSGDISFVSLLDEALGDEPVPMKQGAVTKSNPSGKIPALAKTDAALLELKKHPSQRVRDLIAARQGIRSWPLHIKRINKIVAQARAAGGLIRVPLHYHLAHTGRWTGGEKINLQNLSARNPDPLMQRIRQIIIAPPGMKLVVADASQIEARVLAWIAGQWDLIKAFANNEQIYCRFASEVLGKPVRKARETDPPPVAKWLKTQRSLGKVGVLGCGYGMGWERCLDYAKNTYGVALTASMAHAIVDHYRDTNRKITKFWRDIEQAFKFVTRYPGQHCDLDRGLHFRNEDDCTTITLPCGRDLQYPEARVTGTGYNEQIKVYNHKEHKWTYVWGGYLTENVVQAMSRDLLAGAMLDLETQGIKIGLHVHDEIIAVAAEAEAESTLSAMLSALCAPVDWAQGLPLEAEGRICERYGKT